MILVTGNRRLWAVSMAVSIIIFAVVYFTVIKPDSNMRGSRASNPFRRFRSTALLLVGLSFSGCRKRTISTTAVKTSEDFWVFALQEVVGPFACTSVLAARRMRGQFGVISRRQLSLFLARW